MRKWKRALEPHIFLLPSYIIIIFFMGYPLANCIRLAFSNYKITQLDNVTFAGLANFKRIFEDDNIGMIAANTIKFVVVCVICQLLLGLILALALKKKFRGRGIYQGIVFLPWAFSGFVIGLNFQWMFNGEYGVINDILLKLNLIESKISFMGSPTLSLVSVMVAMIWGGIPFFGIMLLAALQSVPEELMEAAKIDGANSIRRFWNVTIPCIKPTLVTTVLLRTIWIFNSSDLIYIMTKGGPANTSHTLSSYMFAKAYSTLDFGYASALGVLFMIILSIFLFIYFKLTNFSQAGED